MTLAQLTAAYNQLLDFAKSLTPIDSATIHHDETPAGTKSNYVGPMSKASPPITQAVSTTSIIDFAEEWQPDKAYPKKCVVVLRQGIDAGTYVAAKDVPANSVPSRIPTNPTQGIYWVQIAPGSLIGTWT